MVRSLVARSICHGQVGCLRSFVQISAEEKQSHPLAFADVNPIFLYQRQQLASFDRLESKIGVAMPVLGNVSEQP